jgi:hypothetical protein
MEAFSDWFLAIFFVLTIVALSTMGLIFVRKRVDPSAMSKHNDVASAVFSIVGTLYTVLLAFVVIVVWEDLGTAEERSTHEAGVFGDLMRDTAFMNEPLRSEFRKELLEYGHSVIEDEWPLMAQGESSETVWQHLVDAFEIYAKFQPETPQETNVHAEMLNRLNELSELRTMRLSSSASAVPRIMWGILIAGGIITIAFSYFLGVADARSHLWMTASMAAMIALTLYIIVAMDHPFGGRLSIEPDALEAILERFE